MKIDGKVVSTLASCIAVCRQIEPRNKKAKPRPSVKKPCLHKTQVARNDWHFLWTPHGTVTSKRFGGRLFHRNNDAIKKSNKWNSDCPYKVPSHQAWRWCW
eukprot:TRINITY_DN49287_c0_g1_i1.p1 TRINITY_DN49287_c0_g1~~TRINITY_DN49287_c0_g1_i1.p1  ORF type:complete len:101 (-),score=3.35 TRINITY_DN49287_c0_g1_i1:6-308(-)